MKKSVVVSVLFAFVMLACSSSSDDEAQDLTVDTSGIFLKKRIKTTNGLAVTENFTYDGNKLVSIETSTGLLKRFIYTNNLITRVEWSGTGIPFVTANGESFEYNAQNQLVRKVVNITQGGNLTAYSVDFTHNNDGTISYVKQANGNTQQPHSGKIHLISNLTGLDISDVYYVADYSTSGHGGGVSTCYGGTKTKTIEDYYDAQLNPLKNILGFKEILFAGIADFTGSIEHNIRQRHTFSTSVVDNNPNSGCNTSDATTTSYRYNAMGFPTYSYRTVYSDSVMRYEEEYFYE